MKREDKKIVCLNSKLETPKRQWATPVVGTVGKLGDFIQTVKGSKGGDGEGGVGMKPQ